MGTEGENLNRDMETNEYSDMIEGQREVNKPA